VVAGGYIGYQRFYTSPQASAPAVAVAAAPQLDPATLKKKAIDAYRANDLETAWLSITQAAVSSMTDPEVWNDLGLIAKKRGNLLKAREAYQKALELRPNFAEAQNNLGVVELQDGNVTKAKELFLKALEVSPAYAEANFNLALLYDRDGDLKSAATSYRRFLQVSGAFPSEVVESVRDRILEIEPK